MWPWKYMYSQNRKRKSNHIFPHWVPLHLSCSNIFKLTSSVRKIEMSQMFSLFSDEELWNAGCTAWNQKKAFQGERQPSQSQSYSTITITITITFNNHNHNQQSEEGISGKEALRIRWKGIKWVLLLQVKIFTAGTQRSQCSRLSTTGDSQTPWLDWWLSLRRARFRKEMASTGRWYAPEI